MNVGAADQLEWEVEGDPPVLAMRRGSPVLRGGSEYLVGSLWLRLHGVRRGRLTYEVHESRGMVQLGNVDVDDPSLRGHGGGSTLLDRLEARFPSPVWWIAADERDLHSQDGLRLIRSRRRQGRRWIHTTTCDLRMDSDCECDFA